MLLCLYKIPVQIKYLGINIFQKHRYWYCTDILWRQFVFILIAIRPAYHLDEIRHERRDRTFQNGRVSTNDVFVVHFCLVELLNDCEKGRETRSNGICLISCTVRRSRIEIIPLVRMPRDDRYEIGHEWRHLTFQNSCVATDGIFFVNICVVVLLDHCNVTKNAKKYPKLK